MLLTLLAFAIALGLLITFHELGHYWVARWCGVRILRFSVGFGRVLWRRVDRHGTEWALSAIPLGGYVKMLDDPEPQAGGSDAQAAFNTKPVGQRFAIVAAGPIANLVLAAVLYAALAMAGTQEPAAILAQPQAGTPAAQAGLQEGDRIVAVDGQAVLSWGEVRWKLLDALAAGGTHTLAVQSGQGVARDAVLDLPAARVDPEQADPLAQAGLALAAPRPRVTEVVQGSAAERAGLSVGDIVLAVDALQQPTASQLVAHIQARSGQTVRLQVQRDAVELTLHAVPDAHSGPDGAALGRLGVMLGGDLPLVTVRYGVLESLERGVTRTAETVWYSLKMMGRMVTGDVSVRNISGPVTIADYAGQTARIGLAAYLGFLALISVSIGVLNLLPIPMLDGGHLLYYLLEMLRGKPLSDLWLQTGQRIGLGLLAALMGLAFFNDFSRLFS